MAFLTRDYRLIFGKGNSLPLILKEEIPIYSDEEIESFKRAKKLEAVNIELGTKSSPDISIKADDDYFYFPSIPYMGYAADIAITKYLLCNANTYDGWLKLSQASHNGIVIPNSQIMYQLMRRAYQLRDCPNSKEIVNEFVKGLRNNFDRHYLIAGTKINFGSGLEATIEHLQLDKSLQSIILDNVPEFTKYDNNWSYLILAKEQPGSGLGNVEAMPDNAKPFLEALLGEGYEEAGAVCQYIASRKNNLLREIRLWAPTASNRNNVWALVLGVYFDRFDIYAIDSIDNDRPARGVVSRKIFP